MGGIGGTCPFKESQFCRRDDLAILIDVVHLQDNDYMHSSCFLGITVDFLNLYIEKYRSMIPEGAS